MKVSYVMKLWNNETSCKESPERILRLQRDSNPWPARYRCDALLTGYEASLEAGQRRVWIYTRYMKRMRWCVYDKDHMSALRIKNTSESDPLSYEGSCKESPEKIVRLQRDSNPWPPRYRCDALPTEVWSLVGRRSRASVEKALTGLSSPSPYA